MMMLFNYLHLLTKTIMIRDDVFHNWNSANLSYSLMIRDGSAVHPAAWSDARCSREPCPQHETVAGKRVKRLSCGMVPNGGWLTGQSW